jgi:hypothetical protein
MTKDKRNRDDRDLGEAILDADDTGLVRNEAEIVEEEIEEALSREDPVDGSGPEGRAPRKH